MYTRIIILLLFLPSCNLYIKEEALNKYTVQITAGMVVGCQSVSLDNGILKAHKCGDTKYDIINPINVRTK